MMKSIVSLVFLISVSFQVFALEKKTAVTPEKIDSSAANPVVGNQLLKTETQHNFDEILVQGQYHFSNEAVTTVEEDKVLDALIGVRSDFKDRLEKSSTRY